MGHEEPPAVQADPTDTECEGAGDSGTWKEAIRVKGRLSPHQSATAGFPELPCLSVPAWKRGEGLKEAMPRH
jgi:hypothetical protein